MYKSNKLWSKLIRWDRKPPRSRRQHLWTTAGNFKLLTASSGPFKRPIRGMAIPRQWLQRSMGLKMAFPATQLPDTVSMASKWWVTLTSKRVRISRENRPRQLTLAKRQTNMWMSLWPHVIQIRAGPSAGLSSFRMILCKWLRRTQKMVAAATPGVSLPTTDAIFRKVTHNLKASWKRRSRKLYYNNKIQ